MKRRDFLKLVGVAVATPSLLPKAPVAAQSLTKGLIGVWPPELAPQFRNSVNFDGTTEFFPQYCYSRALSAGEVESLYNGPFQMFKITRS